MEKLTKNKISNQEVKNLCKVYLHCNTVFCYNLILTVSWTKSLFKENLSF